MNAFITNMCVCVVCVFTIRLCVTFKRNESPVVAGKGWFGRRRKKNEVILMKGGEGYDVLANLHFRTILVNPFWLVSPQLNIRQNRW